ncbi:MAG: MFS transporter [Bryobacterales bacterium]|nr:MFS transporter [Bryobacterales bacterium]MBV9396499.1 MFS transporter [Bryobacterales bacterium]
MASRKSQIGPIIRVATGNALEMYDFQIFGYYAASIGATFFPSTSEFASLMAAFATFGAGFLMRPLGAVVLGAFIDHRGRRAGLLLTLSLMAAGTLSIALLPGYRTLGLLAPLLVLLGRLIQGFSAGVELGGVSVYLSEIATPGRKGFYVSWQSGSQQVAVMFAAVLGIALTSVLSPAQMTQWGWRLPLLIGSLLVPFLFLLRRSLEESRDFLDRPRKPRMAEIVRMLASNWRLVALGMMMATMTTVCFYLVTTYTPTFGSSVLHLAPRDTLIVTLCVGACNLIVLPLSGALSDRIGRRPILIGCTLTALATAYPALLWLVSAPSFARLLGVELWLAFFYASYNGAMAVFLTEIMPAEMRISGFSLAYSTATALFGGFTPAICTYLIRITGNRAVPGLWLSFAAICGLAAALILSEPARAKILRHSEAAAVS